MSDNIHQVELFDQYLRNELSGEERLSFETKLTTEPALNNAFLLHKAIIATAKEHGKDYDRIGKIYAEVRKEQQQKKVKIKLIASAAAALFLLALAWQFLLTPAPSLEQLMAMDEYNPIPELSTNLGENPTNYQDLESEYKQGNYLGATSIFEQLKSPDTPLSYYLPMAYAYRKTGNFSAAQQLYDDLINGYYPNADQAKWGKALTYVVANGWNNAKITFQGITQDQGMSNEYQKGARKFLAAINQEIKD